MSLPNFTTFLFLSSFIADSSTSSDSITMNQKRSICFGDTNIRKKYYNETRLTFAIADIIISEVIDLNIAKNLG